MNCNFRTPLLGLLLVFFAGPAFWATAQIDSLNYGPEPPGGIAKLAVEYFKIDFNASQRKQLEDVEVELIYFIDERGNAEIEKINGVSDPAIIDSLIEKTTTLPAFTPQFVDGKAVPSVYFLKLSFPKYNTYQTLSHNHQSFRELTLDDLESYTKGSRLDILIGGMLNFFGGSPSKYLATGGGMKIDMLFYGSKGNGVGMVMNFYGNRSKADYPLATSRPQNNAPPTLLVGLAVNKRLMENEKREFNLQLDLCYAIQNITPRINQLDKDYVQFKGFSPGLAANYVLMLGKTKLATYYWDPALARHSLNFHVAVRPLLFNFNQASGLMFELGISYRFKIDFLKSYTLK